MDTLAKSCIALAAIAFVMAVIANFGIDAPFILTTSEGFSRASANLALMALALVLVFRGGSTSS